MALPSSTDVAIVGAGAAGLATGIFLRRLARDQDVLLLDGARKIGAKILVSGGSRCNVTNAVVTERDFNGGRGTIVRRVLAALPVPDTIAFFRELGVSLHEEPGGKLFPDSNRSRDVLDALLREIDRAGARLLAGHRVTDVRRSDGGFEVATTSGPTAARHVVLATGGLSLPKSGSDGGGYEIARRLGHSLVPTTPALDALRLEQADGHHPELQGVTHDVELTLWLGGAVFRRVRGALLWTHFGVSGPAALDASRHILRAALEGRRMRVTVSFLPGHRFDRLDALWTELARERPTTAVHNALATLLPASVARLVATTVGIPRDLTLAHLERDTRRRLVHALLEWPLPVTGSRGYQYAEATAGGVPLDEIDPVTMESRRCRGLFLVGEILDVDGRLGGFNFQWAWASARAAAGGLTRRLAAPAAP